MYKQLTTKALSGSILILAALTGCGETTVERTNNPVDVPSPNTSPPGEEISPSVELEQPELEQPELEQPELEQPELEQPELEQPELEQPELEQPELEQPELEQPAPTQAEINSAISKLQAMNPDEVLEFPVEGDNNYLIIGFKEPNDQYLGLNARWVEEFLQESLKTQGKFPENSQIELIVKNQSSSQRLVLKPISKNVPLGNFVRVLNTEE